MRLPTQVLEPSERIAEILFGLIMALTVTGATSVVTADRTQIRTMLIAALGCNIAWGIIDAGMSLWRAFAERGSNAWLLRGKCAGRSIVKAPTASSRMRPAAAGVDFSTPAAGLDPRRTPPADSDSETRPRLTGRDWFGALGVCILVILSTFRS